MLESSLGLCFSESLSDPTGVSSYRNETVLFTVTLGALYLPPVSNPPMATLIAGLAVMY